MAMTEPSRAPEWPTYHALVCATCDGIGSIARHDMPGSLRDTCHDCGGARLVRIEGSATPASPAESGWVIVIDLPAVGLGYWDGHAFPPDNLKAVRFARKYDAEVVRGSIKEWQARTEEHGWG